MLDKELLRYIGDKKKYIFLIVLVNVIGLIINVTITFLMVYGIKDFIGSNIIDGLIKMVLLSY